MLHQKIVTKNINDIQMMENNRLLIMNIWCYLSPLTDHKSY